MADSPNNNPGGTASLSPWDGISIIIGIVIGVSIFKVPPIVFSNVDGPVQALGVWVLGGALSLIGALCYAELTTTYPQSGGDYVYLTRAYGRWLGFLFGWAQLIAILTGSIGAMAYVFADYAAALWSLDASRWSVWLAATVVVVLAVVNILGVVVGKTVQNILTIMKLAGMAAIIVAGLVWGGSESVMPTAAKSGPGLGLAMIFVLYAYGGWNDAAFVASEVRDRRRNLPRVLLIGTGSIMAVYVLVNAGYLWGLGFDGVRASQTPAADVLRNMLGDWGSKGMSVLVMISVLGAVNGMIFTGSRIYASLGADHRVFALLGHWNRWFNAPIWSIATSAGVALAMIFTVGTQAGQAMLDRAMAGLSHSLIFCFGAVGGPAVRTWALEYLKPLPWDEIGGGFDTLVSGTAPVFWLFFLLTGLSLFTLRDKDRNIERPFSVPGYPFTPFVFCLTSLYMLHSSLTYARQLALIGIVPLAIGVPLYFISQRFKVSPEPRESETREK
jgi:amino acid transporter